MTAAKLWGVGPKQKQNRYLAVTTVTQQGKVVDIYETPFGVRTLRFDANQGFFLKDEQVNMTFVWAKSAEAGAAHPESSFCLAASLEVCGESKCPWDVELRLKRYLNH